MAFLGINAAQLLTFFFLNLKIQKKNHRRREIVRYGERERERSEMCAASRVAIIILSHKKKLYI